MLVKILIIVGIVAGISFTLRTLFRLFAEAIVFAKFKGKLDDVEFDVKVVDEAVQEAPSSGVKK